jgi:flagellar hook-basal body complex protein FliE
MQPIQALGPLLPPSMISGTNAAGAPAATAAGPTFKELLLSSLERASSIAHPVQSGAASITTQEGTKPMGPQAAMQEAQAALQTATQVRDALLGAYNEIKELRI